MRFDIRRPGNWFALVFAATQLTSCALGGGSRGEDLASGAWTGAWYRAGERDPAGVLRCRLEAAGPEAWEARFEAPGRVDAIYELTLRGRREGRRVIFDEPVDLGRAGGGRYEWRGEIDGERFQGTFRHPSGDGRFEMVRRHEPGAEAPAAEAPDSDAAAAGELR